MAQAICSIDPGPTCGWALATFGGAPYAADFATPAQMFLLLEDWLATPPAPSLDLVLVEEYRIFPDKLQAHSGKTVPTAEIIGAIKYICAKNGVVCRELPAGVKRTTSAILKGRGLAPIKIAHGTPEQREHPKDAQVLYWYYAMEGYKRWE